jgi:rubrerythrin
MTWHCKSCNRNFLRDPETKHCPYCNSEKIENISDSKK